MKESEIASMTVAKLKVALKARGKPQSGRKADLVKRLLNAVQEEEAESTNTPPDADRVVTQTSGASVAVPESPIRAAAPASDQSASSDATPPDVAQQQSQEAIQSTKEPEPQDSETTNETSSSNDVEQVSTKSTSPGADNTQHAVTTSESAEKTPPRVNESTKRKRVDTQQIVMKRGKVSTDTTIQVRGLVRPFRTKELEALLAEHGNVTDFWIDRIKSRCFATYDSNVAANAACQALDRNHWPEQNRESVWSVSLVQGTATEAGNALFGNGPAASQRNRSRDQGSLSSKLSSNATGVGVAHRGLPARSPQQSTAKAAPSLDQLFTRTKAKPALFWKPVSKAEVMMRKLREAKKKKRASRESGGITSSKRNPDRTSKQPCRDARR